MPWFLLALGSTCTCWNSLWVKDTKSFLGFLLSAVMKFFQHFFINFISFQFSVVSSPFSTNIVPLDVSTIFVLSVLLSVQGSMSMANIKCAKLKPVWECIQLHISDTRNYITLISCISPTCYSLYAKILATNYRAMTNNHCHTCPATEITAVYGLTRWTKTGYLSVISANRFNKIAILANFHTLI